MRSGDELLDTFFDTYASWTIIVLSGFTALLIAVMIVAFVVYLFTGDTTCILGEDGLEYCR